MGEIKEGEEKEGGRRKTKGDGMCVWWKEVCGGRVGGWILGMGGGVAEKQIPFSKVAFVVQPPDTSQDTEKYGVWPTGKGKGYRCTHTPRRKEGKGEGGKEVGGGVWGRWWRENLKTTKWYSVLLGWWLFGWGSVQKGKGAGRGGGLQGAGGSITLCGMYQGGEGERGRGAGRVVVRDG